ncbi:MAG: ribonuclease P protein component [Burkholderiaceae bacterium]|nr:ribonuclease P protein component [Roseateles sp.]MBV8471762.1 ribonuclease P protein component [Burkholderiaceae bacterium]
MGRIQRSADFERVLGAPGRARSPHFVAHHLGSAPSRLQWKKSTARVELSTGPAPDSRMLVDESLPAGTGAVPVMRAEMLADGCWLGTVVPKRHARRSVTRSLLKRQIRAAFGAAVGAAGASAETGLAPGLWVVRLRAPFDRKQFPSAASDALRAAAREELDQLVRKLLAARVRAAPQG